MSRTESSMAPLGMTAPDFRLVDALTQKTVSLSDLMDAAGQKKLGLMIMFVCVHCPYVKHVEAELARIGDDYSAADGTGPIAIAAIQPNDVEQFPEDAPDRMFDQAKRLGWTFPYLLDSSQDVARAYGAACTPDFFLFDHRLQLVYRGQLDDSRPRRGDFGNEVPVTGKDLREAIDALIAGKTPNPNQRSSIGCNIKWRSSAVVSGK
ncbi:MAG: thioredoxin family protein [Acidobacteriaceae bacterium]